MTTLGIRLWAAAALFGAEVVAGPAHADPAPSMPSPVSPSARSAEAVNAGPRRNPELRPFGAGARITVASLEPSPLFVYVARAADAAAERPSDYDFREVGRTPITFELPPGSYWLDVEGPKVTRGSLSVRMGREAKALRVRGGSSAARSWSTLTLALGATALVAATAILGSSAFGDANFDRAKVVIPLYVGGGVLLGGGVALYVASRTQVGEARAGHDEAERKAGSAWRAGIAFRF
jgi:hypothetical protein